MNGISPLFSHLQVIQLHWAETFRDTQVMYSVVLMRVTEDFPESLLSQQEVMSVYWGAEIEFINS